MALKLYLNPVTRVEIPAPSDIIVVVVVIIVIIIFK